jgi:2'-5' RNA ligase
MDEQLSFFGSAGTDPKDSLYFALRPEGALGDEMARYREDLCARHGLKPKLVPVERFHLTLLDVGSFDGLPSRYVEGALRAGQAAAALAEPFEFELNQSLTYSGRFLVLVPESPVPLLKALREELLRQTTKQGLKVASGSGLSAHVTLAYIKQHLAKEAMGPLTWPVTEIALIHSIKNQPEIIELGRWRL